MPLAGKLVFSFVEFFHCLPQAAGALWKTKIHEARVRAAETARVTPAQMDRWA
ncbi:MAG: hypothetical protein M3Y69_06765 [Verrucomicrobiota bacterium]|nr:hypothetical protein [Verrucomicrobiota bacterium]